MILLLAAGSNSSTLNDVEPGLLGFLVVAALGLALVFLLRSMNKQFRKIGPPPEDAEDTAAATADEARDDAGRRRTGCVCRAGCGGHVRVRRARRGQRRSVAATQAP